MLQKYNRFLCKIIYLDVLLISCFVIFLSCSTLGSTPGELLKKNNPALYDEIVGTWYILSNNEFGKVANTITFNDDGSIKSDFTIENKISFSNYDFIWASSEGIAHSNCVQKKDNFDKCNQKSADGEGTIFLFDKSGKARGKFGIKYGHSTKFKQPFGYGGLVSVENPWVKSIYTSHIPPLFSMQIGNNYYACVKDLKVLEKLKTKQSSDVSNCEERFSKLNKKSLSQLNDFITSCTDENIKSQATKIFDTLLESNAKKYIAKYFNKKNPKFKFLFNYTIYDPFGNKLGIFSDLFTLSALSKKELEVNTEVSLNPLLGYQVTYEIKGQEGVIYFKKSGNHLIYHAVRGDNGLPIIIAHHPRLQGLYAQILQALVIYPSFDNLDSEIINDLSK